MLSRFFILTLLSIIISKENNSSANFSQDPLTAQIDLMIYKDSDKSYIAKNSDIIHLDEKFKIFLKCNQDANLFILNKSQTGCKIISDLLIFSGYHYTFPDKSNFFIFDTIGMEELFILIYKEGYSNSKILLNPSIDCEVKYEIIKKDFIRNFFVEIKPVPPILQKSGNIRTTELSQEHSAKDIIIKKYTFDVRK